MAERPAGDEAQTVLITFTVSRSAPVVLECSDAYRVRAVFSAGVCQ